MRQRPSFPILPFPLDSSLFAVTSHLVQKLMAPLLLYLGLFQFVVQRAYRLQLTFFWESLFQMEQRGYFLGASFQRELFFFIFQDHTQQRVKARTLDVFLLYFMTLMLVYQPYLVLQRAKKLFQ